MTEYIKKEDAIAVFGDIHPLDYNASAYVNAIKNLPSADVSPVVHGRWIFEPGLIPHCSVCGRYSDDADTGDAKWCAFCGATMDKEDV